MNGCGRLAIRAAAIFSLFLMLTGCEDSSGGDGGGNAGRNQVVGTWNVVSDWRWSRPMRFPRLT